MVLEGAHGFAKSHGGQEEQQGDEEHDEKFGFPPIGVDTGLFYPAV